MFPSAAWAKTKELAPNAAKAISTVASDVGDFMAHLVQMEQRKMHYLPAQAGEAHATATLCKRVDICLVEGACHFCVSFARYATPATVKGI
jgi:hypothetical protein